jgi:putative ABC transport system ATP-binding protein
MLTATPATPAAIVAPLSAPDVRAKLLVDICAIRKSYFAGRLETPVLFGIDLAVQRGDYVAIMGQSGSGKSTLMNILGCLDTPTQGAYRLDGHDVTCMSPGELATVRNRTIGFVFHSFNLLKRMNVVENVALPLIYAGVTRKEAARRANVQLEKVGLTPYAQRLPNQLSGGQQQRVAIARALVADPPLILADEPTGNLDTRTSEEIIAVLKYLNEVQKQTIILVTHEPDVAAHAKRLVRLKDGLVLFDGPAAEGLGRVG